VEKLAPGSPNPSGKEEKKAKKKNWKKIALALQKQLEELEEEMIQLQASYVDLTRAGLSEREQIQLRRYRHLAGRVMNLQVNGEARIALDEVLEEMKHIE